MATLEGSFGAVGLDAGPRCMLEKGRGGSLHEEVGDAGVRRCIRLTIPSRLLAEQDWAGVKCGLLGSQSGSRAAPKKRIPGL